MEHALKPSQRLGQRLYDALRRSKLKFAGRRFHERSLRADDTNRGLASSDVAKLEGSQAALHQIVVAPTQTKQGLEAQR
jgi:hypothetical protein